MKRFYQKIKDRFLMKCILKYILILSMIFFYPTKYQVSLDIEDKICNSDASISSYSYSVKFSRNFHINSKSNLDYSTTIVPTTRIRLAINFDYNRPLSSQIFYFLDIHSVFSRAPPAST